MANKSVYVTIGIVKSTKATNTRLLQTQIATNIYLSGLVEFRATLLVLNYYAFHYFFI